MAKQSKRAAAELKKVAAKATSLQAQLKKADARTARWKAEAKQLASEMAKKDKQLKKLTKKQRSTPSASVAEAPATDAAVVADGPDETWTVARLREAARDAEIQGYSRMTKPALLAALSRTR